MATSGSKSVAVTSWDTLKFSWSQKSQSVANNTTIISWTLQLIATSDGAISSSASKTWSVTVNGTKYNGTNTVGISNNNTKTLASGTTTITHADDGTKSFSYSFSQQFDITFNGWIGTISGSGSGTLNTIPRASQPSLVTWPETTGNVGDFGETFSIHMNRKSDAFTHTVRYAYGDRTGTIATGVTTGTTWAVPLSFMNDIPAATSASGRIYVDTYNGSTLVGTKYTGFTVTVPASVKPSCSLTLEDITGADDIYGSPVQGLSKIKITVNSSLAYSSPIVSYTVKANGAIYSTATATTGALKTSGDSLITVTLKDKRGRTGSASYTMKVLAYAYPVISALTVQRCDANGTENDQGEYIRANFSAVITSLNSKNIANYVLRYKKTTESNFTSVTLSNLANVYTINGADHVFEADSGSSYDVEVTATDRHGTTTRITSASTAFTLMNWGADGTSIGMLKVAERPGAVDVGGDIYLNGRALYGAHGMIDNRSTNEIPEWYMTTYGRGTVWEFKELEAIGFTAPSSTYGPVQTIIPWKDASGGLPRQVAYEGRTRWTRIAGSANAWGSWQSDALIAYPVGSIYISYSHINPTTLFGGTWVRLTGGFLWASQAGDTIGQTGGEREHKLTVNELPVHTHGSTYTNSGDATKTHAWLASGGSAMAYDSVETGGGAAHNNMPPYIQVSIWRRTA